MNLRLLLASGALLAAAPSLVSAASRGVALLDRIPLTPAPAAVTTSPDKIPLPPRLSVHGLDRMRAGDRGAIETFERLFQVLPETQGDFGGDAAYRVRFIRTEAVRPAEGYELVSDASGIAIRAATDAGLFYGAQTAYQLLAYARHGEEFLHYAEFPAEGWGRYLVPALTIKDEPAYRVRAVMADLGRAPYSLALLKRLVRMMGQLKLNTLHLHLFDDQLCGFRFERLPFGRENPFALDAADLRELVRYARQHHIAVMPELESWGHVASLVYHVPELSGGPGVYGGASFAMGEKTYALLEKLYDEIVPCLEAESAVHVGLDEAGWAVLPGEENKGHTPTAMVGRIHEILMRVGAKHGKKLTMHLWADHGGRALPKEIEAQVVLEPWRYLGADAPGIVDTLKKYGGAGKPPLMMGTGANSYAFSGNYEGTRIWCQEGLKYPNVLGVSLCLWESNDVGGRLVTLYGGANFAWSPATPKRAPSDTTGERQRQLIDRQMRSWQTIFPDADPAAIAADRGPEVKTGVYQWGPFASKPVAPTVDFGRPKGSQP